MTRFELINHLIRKNNYHSYLEIGVILSPYGPGTWYTHYGCFEMVQVDKKVGVDPENVETNIGDITSTYKMTSDEYFASHPDKFDIIFIDGLHQFKQVIKDVFNAIRVLNPGGNIIMHDCNPPDENCASPEFHGGAWFGDVWKAVYFLKKLGLHIRVVDTDCGCAIIDNLPSLEELESLSFSMLNDNRQETLNLVSVEEFLKE